MGPAAAGIAAGLPVLLRRAGGGWSGDDRPNLDGLPPTAQDLGRQGE